MLLICLWGVYYYCGRVRIQDSTATAENGVKNPMQLIDGGNLEADAVNSASGVIMRYGLRSMMRVQFEVATA